ncbi:MAG: peptide ABC transporter substrate-binding protein [Chlamydia sp.]
MSITDEVLEKGRIVHTIDETKLAVAIFDSVHVFCILPKEYPGALSIRIIAPHSESVSEQLISEIVRNWDSSHRYGDLFSFAFFPLEIRLKGENGQIKSIHMCQCIKAEYRIENKKTCDPGEIEKLKEDLYALFSHPNSLAPFIFTKDLSYDKKILQLRQNLIQESRTGAYRNSHDILEELQRLLLSIEKEFFRLRSLDQLALIVKTHFTLKKNEGSLKPLRKISAQAFPSLIKYPFGTSEVLSIVLFISQLDDYERLNSSHLIDATQSVVPEIHLVPESFYKYGYPSNHSFALYFEIEKNGTELFSTEEIQKINDELSLYISSAIEPVVSRIDIPINEEEHLRNILLLSQALKSKKDKPQIIVQFIKQHALNLEFSITLMRVGDEGESIDIEKIDWSKIPDSLHIVPTSSSTVGYIRGKYPKLVLSCFAHCAKKPFSRPNRTIDYVAARQYIITCLEQNFGQIRDVNGGLIGKQKQFFSELKQKLSIEELREFDIIEALFQNISSPSVKGDLSPDSILFLYRSIKNSFSTRTKSCTLLSDSIEGHKPNLNNTLLHHFHPFLFTTRQKISEKLFVQKILNKNISEQNRALTHMVIEGDRIVYILLLRKYEVDIPIATIISNIEQLIQDALHRYQEEKAIRISLPQPTLLLDPRVGTDRTSGILIKMLYEGLMRIDESGKPNTALAEAIEISDDRKKYHFTLRKSVWSNGLPVTAYDFEYAWKKILDPSFKTLYDYLFHPIKNARAVKAGMKHIDELGIIAVNAQELTVILEIPAPYFLELICHWIYSPLSKEMDVKHPGWAYYAEDTYVSNGPFRLTKWKRDSEIQVVKNRDYWDSDAVHLDKIDVAIIEDGKIALQLYHQGKLDWIGEPLTEIPMDALLNRPKSLNAHPISSIQWFVFNIQKRPFQSKKVRQAFHLALNKESIISTALFGDEQPSHSILPKRLSLQKADNTEWNVDKAKRLFSEGIQELGIVKEEIDTLILKVYDQEPIKTVAYAVQQQWEDTFGIPIRVDVISWHQYFESLPELDYDIIGIMWYLWFLDPMYTFETLSSLSNSMNLSQWQHPEFISLFKRAQKETSEIKRQQLIYELEKIAMEETPIVPVFEYTLRYIKNPKLSHVYLSHLGNIDFKWADISLL